MWWPTGERSSTTRRTNDDDEDEDSVGYLRVIGGHDVYMHGVERGYICEYGLLKHCSLGD